jgi:hypothetical protein
MECNNAHYVAVFLPNLERIEALYAVGVISLNNLRKAIITGRSRNSVVLTAKNRFLFIN